ncbi:MAG: glycine cleavage system aminomethyltransferase GcvT [Pirellulales bacterium]|nr:glycine cleavage system aminomethyltransferase GcvT [Pirellulales bacterium]
MTSTLAKTPLHDWHASHGGRLVDFAGWSMPVQYGSIVAEHNATRTAAGLFDVSHMGRLKFSGDGAAAFLDSLVTRRITDMEPGQVRYGLVTNERAGILDDVLVYRIAQTDGTEYYLMVVNASNRAKIIVWINSKLGDHANVRFADITTDTAMIAVQGPLALELVDLRIDCELEEMKYYHASEALVGDQLAIVSRTGYTGEDGCELMIPARIAAETWEGILKDGQQRGAMAAGLGARDTLRLEAAMPLYGHELNDETNPLEAGLNFAVNLDNRTFPGSGVLSAVKRDGVKRTRVGLELTGKRVPREHYGIFAGEQSIGEITSGTFSPTLQKPIAMGYVPPNYAKVGTELSIDLRGAKEPATIVKLPFYKRKS